MLLLRTALRSQTDLIFRTLRLDVHLVFRSVYFAGVFRFERQLLLDMLHKFLDFVVFATLGALLSLLVCHGNSLPQVGWIGYVAVRFRTQG